MTMLHSDRLTKRLLYLGILSPLLFWFATLICGVRHGDYNHLTGTISELGAIGTRSEGLFAVLIFLSALVGILFFWGLCRACKRAGINLIPVIPVLFFCLSLGGISFFHLGNDWHPMVGQVSLAIILSPLLVLLLWRKRPPAGSRRLSWLVLLAMVLVLAMFIERPFPVFQEHFEGLMQRLFHFLWSVWFISLSLSFGRSSLPVGEN